MLSMNRTLQALLLVFAILWQSMAMLSPLSIEKIAASIDNSVMHALEATHHHHDDASAHIEDTDEGLQHQHADSGLQTLGLIPTMTADFSSLPPVSALTHLHKPSPSPTLAGLLRPPRLRA
ncbi:MAG: hypothetical protein RIS97_1315 [Pseudomonadota bacterium]|jgi:hypothetical protein